MLCAAHRMARPSSYSDEIADLICQRIADGQSLREISRDDDMPAKSTIMRWIGERPEFQDRYARAREAQADHYAEEIVEISDDGSNDWMKRRQGEETIEVVNHEHIARSKLRVDSRKWLMAKLAPKKYGDRIDATVGNPDGSPLATERSPREIAMAVLAVIREAQKDDVGE